MCEAYLTNVGHKMISFILWMPMTRPRVRHFNKKFVPSHLLKHFFLLPVVGCLRCPLCAKVSHLEIFACFTMCLCTKVSFWRSCISMTTNGRIRCQKDVTFIGAWPLSLSKLPFTIIKHITVYITVFSLFSFFADNTQVFAPLFRV